MKRLFATIASVAALMAVGASPAAADPCAAANSGINNACLTQTNKAVSVGGGFKSPSIVYQANVAKQTQVAVGNINAPFASPATAVAFNNGGD
jgi:hypothetical protein